jgi:hypothetical protein
MIILGNPRAERLVAVAARILEAQQLAFGR